MPALQDNKIDNNVSKNVSECNSDNPQNCNKSCEKDSNCEAACPIGCINKYEEYKDPGNIDCTQYLCVCNNNQCEPMGQSDNNIVNEGISEEFICPKSVKTKKYAANCYNEFL